MKTKTTLSILLVITALTLASFALIPKQAHSIQGSFLYVSLSYGRGWWGWACTMEEGQTGNVGSTSNYCSARNCPFESIAQQGYHCNSDPPVTGYVTSAVIQVTIPDDAKLVSSDGYVIRDEICADDTFTFEKGTDKGEWWFRGGVEDSPPIHWVDDVEKFVLDLLEYHENTITDQDKICNNDLTYPLPANYKDDMTGIEVFGSRSAVGENLSVQSVHHAAPQVGNVVCSIKEKNLDFAGAKKTDSGYMILGSEATINAEFIVECTYYYYGVGQGTYGPACDFAVMRVPTVIQYGPDAVYESWGHHNVIYNSIEDFFRVGTISLNKNIKVVEPVKEPTLRIKTIITNTELDYGETTYIRLLITNKGATAITLKDIESNVNHEFIYCDKETLEPDEQADCALTLTPDIEADITATVNFEYQRCGKRIESSKKQASSTITVQPLERCTKSEDCKDGKVCCNRICRTDAKGVCDDRDGDGTFEWDYY